MKSKIFLPFIAAGVVFAVWGYFKAVPRSFSESGARPPQIVIEPKIFDLGDVSFGKVVEHSFTVENTGSAPLEISRVSTSCACTKAEVQKAELAPGEQTELVVTYDSAAMGDKLIGERVERFIYVKSNDPQNPQEEVTIYAHVR